MKHKIEFIPGYYEWLIVIDDEERFVISDGYLDDCESKEDMEWSVDWLVDHYFLDPSLRFEDVVEDVNCCGFMNEDNFNFIRSLDRDEIEHIKNIIGDEWLYRYFL